MNNDLITEILKKTSNIDGKLDTFIKYNDKRIDDIEKRMDSENSKINSKLGKLSKIVYYQNGVIASLLIFVGWIKMTFLKH